MTQRHLSITLQPDCKAAIPAVGVAAKSDTYQGEVLNFETPAQFFGQLTEKLWVHVILAALGLLERTKKWWRVLFFHVHAHRYVHAGCLSL